MYLDVKFNKKFCEFFARYSVLLLLSRAPATQLGPAVFANSSFPQNFKTDAFKVYNELQNSLVPFCFVESAIESFHLVVHALLFNTNC